MNKATQEFALLSFVREWPMLATDQRLETVQSTSQEWHTHAAHAAIAEAYLWLEWGVELGFFPSELAMALTAPQQTAFREALQIVSNEGKYQFSYRPFGNAAYSETNSRRSDDARRGPDLEAESLQVHFQQLSRLAAAFAGRRPAATMLATITLERPLGRFSFYELPGVVGKLTGEQIGAVLSAPDEPDELTSAIDPVDAGARGVAGLLQTLDYFASIQRFFDSLYRLTDLQATQLSSSKTRDGPPARPLSIAAVRLFEQRFVACQGWRINLREPQVLRRFVTLLQFAADLIGEELVIDYGRVVRRMADERAASADIEGEARDYILLETFDPRTAIAEWRREALALIDDWVRRLKLTEERGTPPALTTTVS